MHISYTAFSTSSFHTGTFTPIVSANKSSSSKCWHLGHGFPNSSVRSLTMQIKEKRSSINQHRAMNNGSETFSVQSSQCGEEMAVWQMLKMFEHSFNLNTYPLQTSQTTVIVTDHSQHTYTHTHTHTI